jgi:hypothetical protein
MPTPTAPPTYNVPQAVFNGLTNLDYDSANDAFKDSATSTLYYLFVEAQSSGSACGVWQYATPLQGVLNPRGKIPQLTYDIFSGGSYNSSKNAIDYQAKTYKFRLERDATGTSLAKAIEV